MRQCLVFLSVLLLGAQTLFATWGASDEGQGLLQAAKAPANSTAGPSTGDDTVASTDAKQIDSPGYWPNPLASCLNGVGNYCGELANGACDALEAVETACESACTAAGRCCNGMISLCESIGSLPPEIQLCGAGVCSAFVVSACMRMNCPTPGADTATMACESFRDGCITCCPAGCFGAIMGSWARDCDRSCPPRP